MEEDTIKGKGFTLTFAGEDNTSSNTFGTP